MGIRDKQAGLLGWIMLFPIFMGVLSFIFTVLNKAYWDYRVDQMCEVDGGETVYKKVFLDKEEYTKNTILGVVIAPPERSSHRVGRNFLSRNEKKLIRRGWIEVSRMEITIFRALDKEILAKSISYHRGGGNLPFVPSPGHSCGGDLNIGPLLNRTVFLKEKTNDN